MIDLIIIFLSFLLVINSFDLDSDGDGCFDVIEGGYYDKDNLELMEFNQIQKKVAPQQAQNQSDFLNLNSSSQTVKKLNLSQLENILNSSI